MYAFQKPRLGVWEDKGMKHFTMGELCASTTADTHGIKNTPPLQEAGNLKALADNVLDPLREWYGNPIHVNSGYRCPPLNRLVGGAPTSQHTKGEAADITAGSKEENRRLFEYIRRNLPFDQLIDEKDFAWVHVSFRRDGNNRGQVLKL